MKHVACIQDMEEAEVVLTAHMIKGGIIELPVLQRQNLIGIPYLHLASYLMLVLFYEASLIATIQHPFLDSSQAFQQVMYTIRDICWRACVGNMVHSSNRQSVQATQQESR